MRYTVFILLIMALLQGCQDPFEQPEVISVMPYPGQVGVTVHSSIVVRFSHAMDRHQTEAGFSLLQNSRQVTGRFEWNSSGTVMIFKPLSSLSGPGDYTIQLDSSAEDIKGNDLCCNLFSTFSVINDGQGPVVEDFSPVTGTVGVSPHDTVTVTFSEPVNVATIHGGITCSPSVEYDLELDQSGRLVSLVPRYGFNYGTTYHVTVSDSITDMAGNSLAKEYAASFTVGDDFQGPDYHVYQEGNEPHVLYPQVPGTGFEKDRPLVMDFSERVQYNDIDKALTFEPYVSFYVTSTTIDEGAGPFTRAWIHFDPSLDGETWYTLTVGAGIRDLQDNTCNGMSVYTFYTDGSGSIAPRVLSMNSGDPLFTWDHDDAQVLELDMDHPGIYTGCTVIFSEPVNPLTISIRIETIAGTGGLARVINPNWPDDEHFTRYTFDLENVSAGTLYRIIIKGGDDGLQDRDGNTLVEDYVQYIRF